MFQFILSVHPGYLFKALSRFLVKKKKKVIAKARFRRRATAVQN